MKTREEMLKEKEKEEKLKALRKELEAELEEQLSQAEVAQPLTGGEKIRIDLNEVLDAPRAKQVLEALLFASSKPLTMQELRKVIKGYTPKQIEEMAAELRDAYVRENRSFELSEIAGGFEVSTKKEFAPWIFKIELQKRARQATQSALETLAILAYKQPITRAEIEELRGVDVSGVLNTLVERNLIKIVGRKEIPGRPFLYGTTEKFLEHFGLKSLQDLPNMEDIRSIVEKSVKKDELLGKKQIISAPEETAQAAEGESLPSDPIQDVTEDGRPVEEPEANAAKEEDHEQKN